MSMLSSFITTILGGMSADTLKTVLHTTPPPPLINGELGQYTSGTFYEEARAMGDEQEVFTVYKAMNGYYARTSRGALVVGTTLSEAVMAAQAQVTEEALDPPAEEASEREGGWKKLGCFDWSQARIRTQSEVRAKIDALNEQIKRYGSANKF